MFSDSKVNILLVDDHVENLIALEAILAGMSQNLVRAHSGEEALRCLLKQDFAVILLDVQMPIMDGFETAALIRQRERSQHTPIIFVTAFNTSDTWQLKGYSLGAVDYLYKPIDSAILVSKVTVFVELFKKTQEVQRQAAELAAQKIEIIQEQLARQEAETANRMKDEFLAIVSHELRTPLNSILGWSKLLATKQLDEQTTHRALETISRNAQSQAQLIDDILDVARLMRGKLRLNYQPVNLLNLITAELDSMRPIADAKGVQLSNLLTNEPCVVSGDLERLQQVMRNLLSNAIKFTPKGGRVEVGLSLVTHQQSFGKGNQAESNQEPETNDPCVETGYAQISVCDTGIGIQPEFLPYVFEYFRQADSSSTRAHGGLGLGLAIVRQLVHLHNGWIAVASEGDNKGATFTIHLPLDHPIPETEPSEQHTHPTEEDFPSLNHLSVLVVDDNVDNRNFITMVLQQAGCDVTAVATGQEVMAYLQHTQPHVLVSNIAMPEEDGHQLLYRIRKLTQKQGKILPAIALTAYTNWENQDQTPSAGFQKFLPKPIDPAALIDAIVQLADAS